MLKVMRKNTKIVLWFVIAAFVGTIVFAWGMQYTASQKMKNYVAKINGEQIRPDEYTFYYDRLARKWETDNPQAELTEDQKVRFTQQAWGELVKNVLMRQEIRKYGIRVGDAEVVEFLQKYPYAVPELAQIPAFQTNKQFDYNKYLALMNSKDPAAGPFWAQIEALVRPQLLEFKLTNMVSSTARVTDEDVVNRYKEYNEYYKMKMVLVRFEQFRPELTNPLDAELKAEYEKNKEKYHQAERAFATFVRFSKLPSAEENQRVREEITKIRAEAEKAADSAAFAELAKKYSQDPTAAQNGGDLGWFGPGRMVPAFDSAAFSLKPGQLSPPVRSSFGWHLIKLWGKKKDKTGEQLHASHILLLVQASGESLERLKTTAEEFSLAAQKEGFEKAATERKLKIDSSNIFGRQASIGGLGLYPEISEFVFSKKQGSVSPVYNLDNFFAVVKVEKRFSAGIPPFEEAKKRVRADILGRRAKELTRQKAEEIWRMAQSGLTLDSAAALHKLTVATDLIWGWGAWVPGMGDAPAFLGAVIRAHEKNQRLIPPIPCDLGYLVGELLEYLPYDPGRFAAAKDSTAQSIMQKRHTDTYNAWMMELQKKSEIKDYRMEVLGASF